MSKSRLDPAGIVGIVPALGIPSQDSLIPKVGNKSFSLFRTLWIEAIPRKGPRYSRIPFPPSNSLSQAHLGIPTHSRISHPERSQKNASHPNFLQRRGNAPLSIPGIAGRGFGIKGFLYLTHGEQIPTRSLRNPWPHPGIPWEFPIFPPVPRWKTFRDFLARLKRAGWEFPLLPAGFW